MKSPRLIPVFTLVAAFGVAPVRGETPAAPVAARPVVTVAPVPQSLRPGVRAFGTLRPDARGARSVTAATVGVVRSVEVLQGEVVRKGQPLLRVEPDPLAHLAYRQAASAAQLARAELERLKAQRADQLATDTQVEAAEKALADAEAGVEAARQQGATAEVEVVRAPADGIVTALGVGVGDRPAVGTVLAVIAPAGTLRALLGVEPAEALRVHVGDPATVRPVDVAGGECSGHVVAVGAAIDRETRLVNVVVTLDGAAAAGYLAGAALDATIATRPVEAYAVPRAAIVKDEAGTAVFEVREGRAHRVPVVIEVDDGGRVGVSGALDRSRPVVTTGSYELEDGVAVLEQKP